MKVIGLDFGTTNSIVSFYNEATQTIEAWKMGGTDGNNYIPSCLSIEDDEIYIGEEAKSSFVREDSQTFTNFKILLYETNTKKLANYNYKDRSPKEVAKLYLKTLLQTYKEEQNIDKINSLVLTVPEIWIQDDMQARTIIKEIADELKLPLKKLISEPVAAGAYFIDNYKKRNSSSYDGHLLVFDYGGGTLDITLLEASNDAIKTLERTGKGKDSHSIGKAGVAYDELVVMSVYEETFKKKLQKNSQEYHELLVDFEREKINNRKIIKKYVSQYEKSKKLDREIFSLRCDEGKISIMPSSLVKYFDKLLVDDITTSLNEIQEYFKVYGIDVNNHDEFRIIMVGGFSNYYLSEKAVKNFFNSKTESDRRFETHFTLEDTTLAISKGATLIANEFVELDETYPMTIGTVFYTVNSNGELEEVRDVIFKKGDVVTANSIQYCKYTVVGSGKPTLFLDNGRTSYKIKIDKNPEDIFPNCKQDANEWEIGFSIDENSFYYIHIKDKSGAIINTEIGNILEEYKDSIIVEQK